MNFVYKTISEQIIMEAFEQGTECTVETALLRSIAHVNVDLL